MPKRRFLLLRGLGRDQRHWGDFPSRLADTLGAHLLMLDLPGVGTERLRPCPRSLYQIMQDIRQRWKATWDMEQSPGDNHWELVSISMGSMIALCWAAEYPQDFQKIYCTNVSFRGSGWPRFKVQELIDSRQKSLESSILHWTSNRRPIPEDWIRQWEHYRRQGPISLPNLLRQLNAAMLFKPPTRIETPLEFWASRLDRLADPRHSERLASQYRASYFEHPTAGHDLFLDDPYWVIDRIRLELP